MAGGSTGTMIAATLVGGAITLAKFAASVTTGSSAMLAEAIRSAVETGNRGLLLFGERRAEEPSDAAYPSGSGREVYFRAILVAMLLFAFGAGISIHEGILNILDPQPLTNAGWNYAVIGIALVFEAVTWTIAYRAFDKSRGETPSWQAVRQSQDPAVVTGLVGKGVAILGLASAFAGILLADRFGLLWADGAASVIIGLLLAMAAVLLAIKTRGLLIGEAANGELIEEIIGIAGQAAFVDGVNEARIMHFGPADVLVNLSVDARDHLNAGVVETGIAALEAEIIRRHPEVTRVFIEIQKARDGGSSAVPGDASEPV